MLFSRAFNTTIGKPFRYNILNREECHSLRTQYSNLCIQASILYIQDSILYIQVTIFYIQVINLYIQVTTLHKQVMESKVYGSSAFPYKSTEFNATVQ